MATPPKEYPGVFMRLDTEAPARKFELYAIQIKQAFGQLEFYGQKIRHPLCHYDPANTSMINPRRL